MANDTYEKLSWDANEDRIYETGSKQAVLYTLDSDGEYTIAEAWNGLTGVEENPSGAEATDIYADDSKYVTLMSAEKFGCTIKAYTYPENFEACDGSVEIAPGVFAGQQTRKTFGFCYRTTKGNAEQGEEFGYKLHLVYGCLASPSAKSYSTINDSPEAIEFSWEVSTTPVSVKDSTGKELKPTATLIIDSTKVSSGAMEKLEAALYGVTTDTEAVPPVAGSPAYLPLPDEVLEILAS